MLSASMPSASSMAIASRTIVARLSAGWSGSRCWRAHTEGIGLVLIGFVLAAIRPSALLGAYIVRS